MSTATAELVITEPGIYDGIPEDVYHGDPVPAGSLSSSGARKLLTTCPAIFDYERRNGAAPRRVFDFGHAAHELVLGVGAGIAVIDAGDYRTNAAKEARDTARAAGKTPLLAAEYATVEAMAAALRSHPLASALLRRGRGLPEQSMFWQDEQTGVWRRARADWLPAARVSGRTIVTDYKTAATADPREFGRAAASHGYHQQAAWYSDGLMALRGDPAVAFVFIVQEKTAPYVVTVVELDADAIATGRALNRKAIDLYARCESTGRWPGYTDDVALISLPRWYDAQLEPQD